MVEDGAGKHDDVDWALVVVGDSSRVVAGSVHVGSLLWVRSRCLPTGVAGGGATPVPAGYQPGIGVVDTVSARVDSPVVGIGVLGPLTIDGIDPGATRLGPRDRTVLAALVVAATSR